LLAAGYKPTVRTVVRCYTVTVTAVIKAGDSFAFSARTHDACISMCKAQTPLRRRVVDLSYNKLYNDSTRQDVVDLLSGRSICWRFV